MNHIKARLDVHRITSSILATPTNSKLRALHSSNAGDNSRRQDRVPGQGGFAAGAARGAEDREQRRHDPALQSQVHETSRSTTTTPKTRTRRRECSGTWSRRSRASNVSTCASNANRTEAEDA
uniref:Candidate secreted effector n=1 Tax=Meloidogyne incognita TaxID=6306 RepID=A0A914MIR9_MELIC